MVHRFAGVRPCQVAGLLLFAALLTRPDISMAQAAKYQVTGFRDARFGMTETEIRATARDSFAAKDDEMTVNANAIDGTTKLIVHVPLLESGLGEGRVEYFFGYKSKKLIQVDVIWGEDTNAPLNDAAMIAGGARLQHYFLECGWRTKSVRAGVPIADNDVLLFSGEDDRNGAVRLVLKGIHYNTNVNGVLVSSPEPLSPPKLIVSYIAERTDPDIKKLNQRDF
jgi:hypothetical protein